MLGVNFCKRWAGKRDKDSGNLTKDARKSLLYEIVFNSKWTKQKNKKIPNLQADRRTAQAGLGMKTYAVVTDDYRQVTKTVEIGCNKQ